MAEPRVSTIMIFLNAEKFIQEAIESVLAQTYPSWELLLVDDGSTDASTGIAQRYAEQVSGRIRYLEHEGHRNRGMSASRNLGIRHASGEYIAFLDADDVWFPIKLERQVAILRSHPDAAMVYGATQYWHSWTGASEDLARDHIPDLGIPSDTLFQAPALSTLLYPLGTATAPCPSDLLLRRDFVEQVGGFEERFTGSYQLYEDQAFLAKLYLKGGVFVSSESWDRYRIHPDSCSSQVARDGRYHLVRRFFLEWLEAYLHEHRIRDRAVWTALQKALGAARPKANDSSSKWTLRVADGSRASLVYPPDEPDAMHVAIQHAATGTGFDIQLNQPFLSVKAGERYAIHFRARADRPRRLGVGCSEAHAPWEGLGCYRPIELTTEWQAFEEEFIASRDEDNARIHFDLGESGISVDLAAIGLRRQPDGQPVEPTRSAGPAPVEFGTLRQLTPISRTWGFDRGLPVDRYYVEGFLARRAADIRGRVLEIEDNMYTRRFGGDRVTTSDILHVAEGNPRATLVGDLTRADHIPSGVFDCIVLTQTLHLIYDTRAALGTLHRILKPGGVLLATFPGLSRVSHNEWEGSWFWGFTTASARRLFEESFAPGQVEVESFGNVLASISFLHGLATEDLERAELDFRDPDYELLLTVRAVKSAGTT